MSCIPESCEYVINLEKEVDRLEKRLEKYETATPDENWMRKYYDKVEDLEAVQNALECTQKEIEELREINKEAMGVS